jgi:hypothetical protein
MHSWVSATQLKRGKDGRWTTYRIHFFKRFNKPFSKSLSWKRSLDTDGGLSSTALLLLAGNGLSTHNTTTPVAAGLLGLVGVTLLDGTEELSKFSLVL